MKKFIYILMFFITISIYGNTVSQNVTKIGEISSNDNIILKIHVNEKSLIYFETEGLTFTLSGYELDFFKRIMNKNLELVDTAKSTTIMYKRQSGMMRASSPSKAYLMFYFYTYKGKSSITLDLFNHNKEVLFTLSPENAQKMLDLISKATSEIQDKSSQISKLNSIVAEIPKF